MSTTNPLKDVHNPMALATAETPIEHLYECLKNQYVDKSQVVALIVAKALLEVRDALKESKKQ